MEQVPPISDPWIAGIMYEFDFRLTYHFLEFEIEMDRIIDLAKERLSDYERLTIYAPTDAQRLNEMISVLGFFSSQA